MQKLCLSHSTLFCGLESRPALYAFGWRGATGMTEEGAGTVRGEMLCLFLCVDGEKYLPHHIFISSHQQMCYGLTRRCCAKRVQLGSKAHTNSQSKKALRVTQPLLVEESANNGGSNGNRKVTGLPLCIPVF